VGLSDFGFANFASKNGREGSFGSTIRFNSADYVDVAFSLQFRGEISFPSSRRFLLLNFHRLVLGNLSQFDSALC